MQPIASSLAVVCCLCHWRYSLGNGVNLMTDLARAIGNECWSLTSSHLKEYTYKYTGGTGKYEGASGGGTYMYEGLTDTLFGGTYKGQLVLP